MDAKINIKITPVTFFFFLSFDRIRRRRRRRLQYDEIESNNESNRNFLH